jgi:hypothetical protein
MSSGSQETFLYPRPSAPSKEKALKSKAAVSEETWGDFRVLNLLVFFFFPNN